MRLQLEIHQGKLMPLLVLLAVLGFRNSSVWEKVLGWFSAGTSNKNCLLEWMKRMITQQPKLKMN